MSTADLASALSSHPPPSQAGAFQGDGLATSRAWRHREDLWSESHQTFDVLIIGGGIQGACIYRRLVGEGRRVLLVDRGDFGGGTSQSSAMLIWGGFLYLKDFDIGAVARLCAARDRLIEQRADHVEVQRFSYLFGARPHRKPWAVYAALRLYWLLALGRRSFPGRSGKLPGHSFLLNSSAVDCLSFEEARLRLSDAQFVLDWIHNPPHHDSGVALNYGEATEGSFDSRRGCWNVQLRDTLGKHAMQVSARCIVNTTGPWVDRVNARFQVESPWEHLLAKGVSITFPRPDDHRDVLVFDGEGEREGMSLVPWGPVSLWGSTEQIVTSPAEGSKATPMEVGFLLDSLNRHMRKPLGPQDIIALRSGVRPIVVRRGCTRGDPLSLSKRWRLWRDPHRPWISVYGGKLTTCQSVAAQTSGLLSAQLGSPALASPAYCAPLATPEPEMESFADMSVVSARWCVENLSCWTLEDYLRRRTNLAQWIPRGGLGNGDEHIPQLNRVARAFAWPGKSADDAILHYRRQVLREHDSALGARLIQGGVS
jgi:glycerol-3-phosphate dehydrogenase